MNWIIDRLERLNLRTLLMMGSLCGLLVALLIGIYGLRSVSVLEERVEHMYHQELLTTAHLMEANINMIKMSRNMRHMLIAPDEAVRTRAKANVLRAREELLSELTKGRARITDPKAVARYESFERDLESLLEAVEQAIHLIEREPMSTSAAARYITSPEFALVVNRADGGLHELADLSQASARSSLEFSRVTADETRNLAWMLLGAGMLGSMIVGTLIGLSVQRPHHRLRASVERLAAGEVDTAIPHTAYPNEVGTMARAIHVLQGIYRRSNDQTWVKSSAAELTTLLQQSPDVISMAQRALSHLAPLVGAAHGAFYVFDAASSTLRLLGTYGMKERHQLGNEFRLGQGVVGQCAMERSPIVLNAPSGHVRVVSGTGSSLPVMVMAVPLMHRGEVRGVLEVASLEPLSERARALVESASDLLGVNLEILSRNRRQWTQDAHVALGMPGAHGTPGAPGTAGAADARATAA